jgi:dephospho-CoA kinase
MKLKNKYLKLSKEKRLYNLEAPIIGLTGGIATGKSTATEYLRTKGFKVLCADKLIKDIYKRNETLELIKSLSPGSIEKNTINFEILRTNFFKNNDLKIKIESYLYQKLEILFKSEFHEILKDQAFVIYDIPLLFEKKLEEKFDLNILVYSPIHIQLSRLRARDNSTEEVINNILDSQLDIEIKKGQAQLVLDNCFDVKSLHTQIDQLIDKVFEVSK